MSRVFSHYKIFGGFGLTIGLNLFVGVGTYLVLFESRFNYQVVDLMNDPDARFAYTLVICVQTLFLILFTTQNRFIISGEKTIVFVNPLLPFLRRDRTWDSYDYWVTVEEDSSYDTYQAIWLIKNGRIKDRFSSFYYSNYNVIKRTVEENIEGRGQLKIGPFKQLKGLLGFKIT